MGSKLRDELERRGFSLRPPASNFALARLIAEAPFALPALYLDLLLATNGGEGALGVAPGRFCLHPAESVMSEHRGYCVDELAPEHLLIGSSGSGLFFLLEEGDGGRVLSCRASDLGDRSAWRVAFDSFRELLGAFRREP